MLRPAIPSILFWGMLGGIFSCISGYMLSLSGDYDMELVSRHQWMGIFTVLLSFILCLLYKCSVSEKIIRWTSLGVIVLITVTGHLGGSLTHGSDYLTAGLKENDKKNAALKPIPNIQDAVLYTDVVQPLFQAKCYGCHGPDKQKGKLRLDQQEFILKGGKEGKALEPGKADESRMIQRMLLPASDEKHMPPKEKPQLTAQEISLLHWWINTGAGFNKKVKELQQTEKIKPVLLALQSGSAGGEQKITDVPEAPVTKADKDIVARLKKAGVMIVPVAQNSNYLSVNFVTVTTGADSLVKLLGSLQEQIVWLKLDHTMISDAAMESIARLTTLTRLQLSNTDITDKGITSLQTLSGLQSLNLTGTKVTAEGIGQLKGLKRLKNLYLYQTGVKNTDWSSLQKIFPSTQLDSGRYIVQVLATDTAIVRPSKK